MSENGQAYSRPPIIEAAVEFRCETMINEGLLNLANERFAAVYPKGITVPHIAVHIDATTGVTSSSMPNVKKSYRRSASDEHDIALINPNGLVVAQSAPYLGWDKFFERIKRDFEIWRKAGINTKLIRIGMRFINRIDVPSSATEINPSDYLNISLTAPKSLGPTISYAVNGNFSLSSSKSRLQVNSAIMLPPPVPKYMSLLLDFDIGREIDVPQKEEDIIDLLSLLRHEKNSFFEQVVTEKAKELFK